MLVGIWGHSCIGKTTWLKSIMDDLPEICPELSVVIADNEQEYHYDPAQDVWRYIVNRVRWKGTKEQKLQWPIGNLILDRRVWVLESMRYFNGMQSYMIDAYLSNGRAGLAMILPHTTVDIYREMQRQRCISLNKPMSPWWELEDNLLKEIKYRAGSAKKWWQPNGVPCMVLEIDAERSNWYLATDYLKGLLTEYAKSLQGHSTVSESGPRVPA